MVDKLRVAVPGRGTSLLCAALLCGGSVAVGCSSPGQPTAGSTEQTAQARAPAGKALGEAIVTAHPQAIQASPADPSSFVVDSFVAALVVQSLLEGSSGLTIEPREDTSGATQGYRIEGVGADSLFARLGLRDGDIIGAINGIGMTSPERAREAIRAAQRQAVVAVERGDTALFFDYRVVDGLRWGQLIGDNGGADPGDRGPAPAVIDAATLVAAVDDDELAALPGPPSPNGRPLPSSSPTSSGKAVGKSGGGSGSTSTSKSKSGSTSTSTSKSTTGSTSASCASADSCTVRKAELDRLVADPSKASQQVRYTPHISGGKHRGYRLTTVTRGSAVDGLGFRKGDVITKVNGHSLTDDGELFALYLGLGGTKTFRINYERGGSKRVKTVRTQ